MEKTLLTVNINPKEAYDVLLDSKLLGEVKFNDFYEVDGKEIVITALKEHTIENFMDTSY